jgi:hypothetical protein
MNRRKMLLVRGTVDFSIDISTLMNIENKEKERKWIIRDELEHLAYSALNDDGDATTDFNTTIIELDEEQLKKYIGKRIDEETADYLECEKQTE